MPVAENISKLKTRHDPRASSLKLVAGLIEKNKGELTPYDVWRMLPEGKGMPYYRFQRVIEDLIELGTIRLEERRDDKGQLRRIIVPVRLPFADKKPKHETQREEVMR